MKTLTNKRLLTALIFGVLFLALPQISLAVGTSQGVTITNNATLSYTVLAGPVQTVSDLTPPSFDVDAMVDLTVQTTDFASVPAAASTTNQYLSFTVTNTGNATFDFILTAANRITTTPDPFIPANLDSFDVSLAANVYVEDGTTPGYQAAEDIATAIDNLAEGVTSPVVYIVGDIGAVAAGSLSVLTLTAQAADSATGVALTQTLLTQLDDTAGTDIVFADLVPGDTDGARDGQQSDSSSFTVGSAILSVNKTATTVWDPVNYFDDGVDAPKAIPGAYVQYEITIANDALASASGTLTEISDILNGALGIVNPLKTLSENAAGALANMNGAGHCIKVEAAVTNRTGTTVWWLTCDAGDIDTDGGRYSGGLGGTLAVDLDSYPVMGADAFGHAAGELQVGESVVITIQTEINPL